MRQTRNGCKKNNHVKIIEEKEQQGEPMSINNQQNLDWTNLYPAFILQLQKEWQSWGFTPQTAQEWINTNFIKPTDINYVQWLKNWAWKKPQDINYNTEQNLRKKYQEYF